MKFPITLPCIKVTQPLGDFFICSVASSLLKDVAYWIPARAEQTSNGFLKMLGIQRRLSPERAKKIGEYIDSKEATFPNTIILSANFDPDDNYEEDESARWSVSERPDGCFFLTIPSQKKLASVIDGQHRLAGFDFAIEANRKEMQLPCAVFLDLPKAYQANIFATINFNQKRVDKSLAYQLFGYELDENDNKKWSPNLVALFIARVLNAEELSPFRGHIKLALAEVTPQHSPSDSGLLTNSDWAVSIAAIVEGIEKLISSNQSSDRNLLLSGKVSLRLELPADSKAPLRQQYLASEDKTIYRVVMQFFQAISEAVWSNAKTGSFINKTVGILASFDILRLGLISGKIGRSDTYETSKLICSAVTSIDFSDDFFHASGAGRVRIRNVIGVASGLISENDLRGEQTANQVSTLIKRYQFPPVGDLHARNVSPDAANINQPAVGSTG
jgi:DNA phosphorothioation-associated DGQHR protein 1